MKLAICALNRVIASSVLVTLIAGCSPAAVLNVTSGGPPETRDRAIAYGELPRQRYDIYRPEEVTSDTPVVIFFYGGSWSRGSRTGYAFVGNALAQEGLITVVADYRVYPQVVFPAFVEDGANVVRHVRNNVGAGRDLFLAGHSAGAHIAALLAFDSRYLTRADTSDCPPVRGFIGLSGPYDFLPLRRQRYRDIFPEEVRAQSQPIDYVSADSPPALLIHGTGDRLVVPENSKRLGAKLQAHGIRTTAVFLEGAGHIKPVAALSESLGFLAPVRDAITDFVQSEQRTAASICD